MGISLTFVKVLLCNMLAVAKKIKTIVIHKPTLLIGTDNVIDICACKFTLVFTLTYTVMLELFNTTLCIHVIPYTIPLYYK